jgi:hypothetical protein
MIDEYVNKNKMTAYMGWACVVGLLATAWVVILVLPDHWKVGFMFAASACTLAAYVSVLHVRCYSTRVAGLVRALSVQRASEDDRPRPVRSL